MALYLHITYAHDSEYFNSSPDDSQCLIQCKYYADSCHTIQSTVRKKNLYMLNIDNFFPNNFDPWMWRSAVPLSQENIKPAMFHRELHTSVG